MWYHLIGISGISMKTIAEILKKQGHKVTGSDLKLSGHSKENIVEGIDVVVYTSAITPGSAGWIEVEESKRKKIKLIKRGKILADLVGNRKVIAVSGTHGKTTTTSMIGLTLIKAGFDPLVIVGEEVKEFNGTYRYGNGEWAVIEACEYDRNFLYLNPQISVITNIEEEHLDHYPGGISELISTFTKFALQTQKDGSIVICGDDKNAMRVYDNLVRSERQTVTYGLCRENQFNQLGFELSIPGDHNRRNALATVAVANQLGIDIEIVNSAISNFSGAHRRFEILGKKNGTVVIDDYGHHPTEIAAFLSGVKEKYPDKKIFTVFWPHQYKRTRAFLEKFPQALSLSSKIIIKEIFFVPGRDEKSNISSMDIVDSINRQQGEKALFIDDDDKIVNYLNDNLDDKYVLVTVGIPPIYKVAKKFLGQK